MEKASLSPFGNPRPCPRGKPRGKFLIKFGQIGQSFSNVVNSVDNLATKITIGATSMALAGGVASIGVAVLGLVSCFFGREDSSIEEETFKYLQNLGSYIEDQFFYLNTTLGKMEHNITNMFRNTHKLIHISTELLSEQIACLGHFVAGNFDRMHLSIEKIQDNIKLNSIMLMMVSDQISNQLTQINKHLYIANLANYMQDLRRLEGRTQAYLYGAIVSQNEHEIQLHLAEIIEHWAFREARNGWITGKDLYDARGKDELSALNWDLAILRNIDPNYLWSYLNELIKISESILLVNPIILLNSLSMHAALVKKFPHYTNLRNIHRNNQLINLITDNLNFLHTLENTNHFLLENYIKLYRGIIIFFYNSFHEIRIKDRHGLTLTQNFDTLFPCFSKNCKWWTSYCEYPFGTPTIPPIEAVKFLLFENPCSYHDSPRIYWSDAWNKDFEKRCTLIQEEIIKPLAQQPVYFYDQEKEAAYELNEIKIDPIKIKEKSSFTLDTFLFYTWREYRRSMSNPFSYKRQNILSSDCRQTYSCAIRIPTEFITAFRLGLGEIYAIMPKAKIEVEHSTSEMFVSFIFNMELWFKVHHLNIFIVYQTKQGEIIPIMKMVLEWEGRDKFLSFIDDLESVWYKSEPGTYINNKCYPLYSPEILTRLRQELEAYYFKHTYEQVIAPLFAVTPSHLQQQFTILTKKLDQSIELIRVASLISGMGYDHSSEVMDKYKLTKQQPFWEILPNSNTINFLINQLPAQPLTRDGNYLTHLKEKGEFLYDLYDLVGEHALFNREIQNQLASYLSLQWIDNFYIYAQEVIAVNDKECNDNNFINNQCSEKKKYFNEAEETCFGAHCVHSAKIIELEVGSPLPSLLHGMNRLLMSTTQLIARMEVYDMLPIVSDAKALTILDEQPQDFENGHQSDNPKIFFDRGAWDPVIQKHPITGAPVFTYRVYLGNQEVGSASFYNHPLLCRSEMGDRHNIISTTGILNFMQLETTVLEDICASLPPTLYDRLITSAKQGARHGTLRGIATIARLISQAHLIPLHIAYGIENTVYYGGCLLSYYQAHALQEQNSDWQSFWSSFCKAALDTCFLFFMNTFLNLTQQLFQQIGRKAHQESYSKVGAIFEVLGKVTPKIIYAYDACQQGIAEVATSMAIGSIVQSHIEYIGKKFVGRFFNSPSPSKQFLTTGPNLTTKTNRVN